MEETEVEGDMRGGHALGASDLEICEDDALFNLAPFQTLTRL